MRKLATIQCLEEQSQDANQTATNSNDSMTFILFHGYGADAYDLRSLSEVINGPRPINFLFPQGVLEVPIGPGWTGRAWWKIDVDALERAQRTGAPRDLSQEKFPELPPLRKRILEAIESLNTPWDKIVLGGFSQGAMLATDIFLHAPSSPKGLVCFSGALICKSEWQPLLENRKGSKFILTHGQNDLILPHKGSAQLESFLNQGGMKGKLISFQGSHEIPMLAIEKTNEYLQNLF